MRKKRDLTQAQFDDKLKVHGFRKSPFMGGLYFEDTTGICPGLNIGAIFQLKPWKFDRRATIAHLIRQREREASRAK
jgi:hypothetical protein